MLNAGRYAIVNPVQKFHVFGFISWSGVASLMPAAYRTVSVTANSNPYSVVVRSMCSPYD